MHNLYAIPYFDRLIHHFETSEGLKSLETYKGDLFLWLKNNWGASLVIAPKGKWLDKTNMYFEFKKESDMLAFILKFGDDYH